MAIRFLVLCVLLGWAATPRQVGAALVLVDGQPAELEAAPVVRDGQVMVWVRDLARLIGGQVYLRSTDDAPVVRRGNMWAAFPVGESEAQAPGRVIPLPTPTERLGDKVLVPVEAACRALNVGCSIEVRLVASITRPGAAPSRGGPGRGAVSGRVTFAGNGVPGVILRLVQADGLTFVPGVQGVTGPDGRYEMPGVMPGAYHVYAYIGDNPRYFNRQTPAVRVHGSEAAAPDLALGMVLEPLSPRIGEVLPPGEAVLLRWAECPGADHYTVTIAEHDNGKVFTLETPETSAAIPAREFLPGRTYVWRVTARAADGSFLGASPGAGGLPWTFTIR